MLSGFRQKLAVTPQNGKMSPPRMSMFCESEKKEIVKMYYADSDVPLICSSPVDYAHGLSA